MRVPASTIRPSGACLMRRASSSLILMGADRGCGCGCLEAAVRYVPREVRHTRGAFRGRLGHVLPATAPRSMSAMPPIVLQKSKVAGYEFSRKIRSGKQSPIRLFPISSQ